MLFVGAIQRRKNVRGLVRAFERMPASWRLALAGAADGFGAAEELQAVESSPRKSDIDVLGHVTQAELEALYRRALASSPSHRSTKVSGCRCWMRWRIPFP